MKKENLSQEEKDLVNKVNFGDKSDVGTSEEKEKEKEKEKGEVKSKASLVDILHRLSETFRNMTTAMKSLVIIAVIMFLVFFVYGLYKDIVSHAQDETKVTTSLVGNYVKRSQDIVSYKYFYTNAAMFENKKNIYGFNLPLTSKRFIISYDGKATLGVDVSQVKTEILGNKIIISNLGSAKILSNEFDEKSMKIFDESTSLFSSWNIKDYQKFFSDQRIEVEKKIMESDLLKEAKSSAEETIKQLLMLNPQIASQYQVEFKE